MTILILHWLSHRIKRSALSFRQRDHLLPVRKVSYILPQKLTITGNLSMHLLSVWEGKWRQCTVSVLELVPSIGIFAWVTGISYHSIEKNRNWFGRQSSIIFILLELPLPSVVALILLS